jgi:hypothetical protein
MIPFEASLCSDCKSYQRIWRNELKYWAGIVGIFALVGSGVAFSFDVGSRLWQRFFGLELAISNLDSFGATIIWNFTDKPIQLRILEIKSSAPRENLAWDVYSTISANSSVKIYLREIANKSWHGVPAEVFGSPPGEYASISREEFDDLLRNRHTDRYVPAFLAPDSEDAVQLKEELGNKFHIFNCDLKLKFLRLWDGSAGEIKVPCIGSFRMR